MMRAAFCVIGVRVGADDKLVRVSKSSPVPEKVPVEPVVSRVLILDGRYGSAVKAVQSGVGAGEEYG